MLVPLLRKGSVVEDSPVSLSWLFRPGDTSIYKYVQYNRTLFYHHHSACYLERSWHR
jgi:hypothetical protein